MFDRIHRKLGTAGFIISIVALVAALGGGAYAASGGLSGKQKKEVEKIAKKYAGKPGAAGATGAAGPKGDGGAPGSNGTSGANGTNGVSVTTSAASTAECPSGGIKVTSASPVAKVCNGTTGFTKTLPKGETETGAWAVDHEGPETQALDPVSFPIPLAAGIDAAHVFWDRLAEEAGPAAELEFQEECPGTPELPLAEKGDLCVYTTRAAGLEPFKIAKPSSATQEVGADAGGAIIALAQGEGTAFGSWAVTAP